MRIIFFLMQFCSFLMTNQPIKNVQKLNAYYQNINNNSPNTKILEEFIKIKQNEVNSSINKLNDNTILEITNTNAELTIFNSNNSLIILTEKMYEIIKEWNNPFLNSTLETCNFIFVQNNFKMTINNIEQTITDTFAIVSNVFARKYNQLYKKEPMSTKQEAPTIAEQNLNAKAALRYINNIIIITEQTLIQNNLQVYD